MFENISDTDLAALEAQTASPFKAGEMFARKLRAADTELAAQALADFTSRLGDMRPDAIFQVLTAGSDPDGLAPIDQHLAVDVAKLIGPEWAQWLYRFAVLVTKLV